MSRSTPRKSRHRHNQSSSGPRQVAASDYESDAAQYMENREVPPPNPPIRDNNELCLSVLRRYQPTIRSLLAIASNAVVYTFLESTGGWEKYGVEGTLFVCDQEPIVAPGTGQVLPRVCVFVLNRRSMDNLVVDLLKVSDCEMAGELLVFRLEGDGTANDSNSNNNGGEGGTGGKKVFGIWIHEDESNPRTVYTSAILGAWQQARQALESYLRVATEAAIGGDSTATIGAQADAAARDDSAAGRRISVTDLFEQKNTGG
ncbi:mRNA-decapping enzyme 1B [Madurella mycetomatis]|uniref:mRNA-decapping enzyme 1B n=1 Tax=Madurella mycetomatis TaxID=100816 RepID=A0A175W732_9PEZI|nr:mRNA-decapping enzyme 1B [Madurella mycetomatis]